MSYDAGKIRASVELDSNPFKQELQKLPGLATDTFGKIAKFAAGAFALSKVIDVIKDVTKTYMESEDCVNNLSAALRNLGEEYNVQTKNLMAYASQIQLTTKYGDEELGNIMTMGLNMGIAADKIKDATKAAVGLTGAYKNLSLDTAMLLIARAANGNTQMLTRYGIALDASLSSAEKFNALLKKGAEMFKLAEAEAQTTSGRIKQLTNAWSDMKEPLGYIVTELFTIRDASGQATNAVQEFTNYLNENAAEWVFSIKYVFYEIQSGFKFLWAVIQPTFTLISKGFEGLVQNASAVMEWFMAQTDGVAMKVTKNIFQRMWVEFKSGLTELNTLIEISNDYIGAFFTEPLPGLFNGDMWDKPNRLYKQRMKELAERKEYWRKNDITPLGIAFDTSSFKNGFDDFVKGYAGVFDRADQILKEKLEKQDALGKWFAKAIAAPEAKRDENAIRNMLSGKSESEKAEQFDIVGSFSSAVINAMMGRQTPAFQTAQNTRKMLDIQQDIRRNGVKVKGGAQTPVYN